MIKILGKHVSINVRKIFWACDELKLIYAHENWGEGYRSAQEPAFLELNPHGLVPVLIDDDFILWESNTILRYLAGTYHGEHLLPTEPKARAHIEKWMDWQLGDLNNAWRPAFMGLVRKSPAFTDAQIETSVAAWSRQMKTLEAHLATHAYVAGDHFTLADIPVGLAVNRWFMTPMQRPDFVAVSRYYERLSTREAFLNHGRNGLP